MAVIKTFDSFRNFRVCRKSRQQPIYFPAGPADNLIPQTIAQPPNRNLPLPRGTEAETWFGTLDRAIDWLSTSSPMALVVSLGLDTFVDDPISHFRLQQPDFMRLGQRLAAIELPTVLVMEGGYATAELGQNLAAVLSGFETGRGN